MNGTSQTTQLYAFDTYNSQQIIIIIMINHNISNKLFLNFTSTHLSPQIYTHGSNMQSLHEHIPPEILPSEFGGQLGPFDNQAFVQSLVETEETFVQSQMYGYISQIAEKGVKKTVSLDAFSPYRRVCIR